MASLNQSLLRRDGYLILRNVIPADRLDAVREACEGLLDRQREIWRQEAGPDDLPGGVWDMRPQPRVPDFHALVDAETRAGGRAYGSASRSWEPAARCSARPRRRPCT